MAAQKSNEEASLTTSQPKCTCAAKFKETELEHIKFRKYLMNQLDEMFDTNKKLSAKLKQQKDLLSKVLSERQQSRKTTISVQTQTDSEKNLKQKPVSFQSASTQTEREEPETSSQLKPVLQTVSTQTETEEPETSSQLKPVLQTVSTQTETDELETRSHWKPVCETVSTQTEEDVLESGCQLKPVYQTISTQTELHLLIQEQSSESQQDGHQDGQTKGLKRSAGKKRRKSSKKAASELETVNNEKVSVKNQEQEEVSMPEIVKDQRATIIIEVHKNEKLIDKLQQVTEDKMVPEKQPIGDHQVEKRPKIKTKCKKKRKTTLKSELENNSYPVVTDPNLVQNTETPKPDVESAPEIPQTALEEIEIKPVIVSEDGTDQDPVVLTEKLRTSPPQTEVTVNEDQIQRPQQSETEPSEESDEQNKVSEEEESPKTKISLWRRFKKAVTPSCLRQFKD
ncbi:titin-like [Gambusia affinis]|uniref:titin-like n=1 Tax=Gambusia affinis TaxID=33528 RepID=UPI001CDB51AC|nr:titin-like [Gambusia affinis]